MRNDNKVLRELISMNNNDLLAFPINQTLEYRNIPIARLVEMRMKKLFPQVDIAKTVLKHDKMITDKESIFSKYIHHNEDVFTEYNTNNYSYLLSNIPPSLILRLLYTIRYINKILYS